MTRQEMIELLNAHEAAPLDFRYCDAMCVVAATELTRTRVRERENEMKREHRRLALSRMTLRDLTTASGGRVILRSVAVCYPTDDPGCGGGGGGGGASVSSPSGCVTCVGCATN